MDRKNIETILGVIDDIRVSGIKVTTVNVAKKAGLSKQGVYQILQREGQLGLLDSLRGIGGNRKQEHAIQRVRQAVAELKATGVKTNIRSVAKHMGLSKQRVQKVLKDANELSILDTYQRRGEFKRIANELKDLDTKYLRLGDIKQLPVVGLAELTDTQMNALLSRYEIPHINSNLDRIKLIENTEQYTSKELFEMVGAVNWSGFRELLYTNKIPFKNDRRNRASVAATLKKLVKIHTANYTLRELHKVVGDKWSIASFRNLLDRKEIVYKKRKIERLGGRK